MKEKLSYLLRSIRNIWQNKRCPNCGGLQLSEVDRKFFITRLHRCEACLLQFRFPLDDQKFSTSFYQTDYQADYSEDTHSITSLPSDSDLQILMKNNFPDKRDHTGFIYSLLQSKSAKVMDFGCSWGYSVYQLKRSGFDAQGYEISKIRAQFGKKIGVHVEHEIEKVRKENDLIMSNHAIEHVPVISDFVAAAARSLKNNGIFMAFCPNGSPEFRRREPNVFHVNWGFLHPNYLDVQFACHLFRKNPFMVLTGDWQYDLNELADWDGRSQYIGKRKDGKELLVIAKPNVNIEGL